MRKKYAQSDHLRDHKRTQSTHIGERSYKVMNVEKVLLDRIIKKSRKFTLKKAMQCDEEPEKEFYSCTSFKISYEQSYRSTT